MVPHSVLFILAGAAVHVLQVESAQVHLNWVSHNGGAAMLGGAPFSPESKVTLTSTGDAAGTSGDTAASATTVVPALDVGGSALKFHVPDPKQAYDVSVDGSAPLCMNLPDPWWWQGDAGNKSTPSGWLRVFGRSIGSPTGKSTVDMQAEAAAAITRADYKSANELLRVLQQSNSNSKAAMTQLRLTPISGDGKAIVITATNASEFDATFELPSSLKIGSYTGEISNGLSTATCGTWRPLSMFLRPDPGPCTKAVGRACDPTPQPCPRHTTRTFCFTNKSTNQCDSAPAPCPPCPNPSKPAPGPPPPVCPAQLRQPAVPIHSTITIANPYIWDQTVFEVDCDWDKPLQERSCGWYGARATTQLDSALAKARAHGGGIVHLRAGVYFIDGPLAVPDGVQLRGESTELVSIYFREVSSDEQNIGPLIAGDGSDATVNTSTFVKTAMAWALSDLSVYVSGFYSTIVHIAPDCGQFRMQRVRIRAAAYFGLQCNINNVDQVFEKEHGGKPRMCSSRGRYANFTIGQGNTIVELGGQNFEIIDNDVLGTATIFHTGGGKIGPRGCSSCSITSTERYGVIARNKIWNANAAHWFDNAHEIIFEHNTIQPAGTAPSWGNNIDNYARGYSQHLFFGYNTYRQVWTGDREILTLDPLFGSYTGGVKPVTNFTIDKDGNVTINNATQGTVLLLDMCSHCHIDLGDLGGAATVVDGTGAGQYRRIVSAGTMSVTVDRPFDTPLDNTSVLQTGPFRGKTIFFHNRYEDGGDWQLYGNAHDWIISNQHMARTGGIKSWGRGFKAPNFCPNIRVQITDCVIEEGNHIANWAISGNWTNKSQPENPLGAGMPKMQIGNGSSVEHKTYPNILDHYGINVQGSDQDSISGPGSAYQGPINNMIVVARNQVHGAGVLVSGHTHNVLVDANHITNAPVGADVWHKDVERGHVKHVLVLNGTG